MVSNLEDTSQSLAVAVVVGGHLYNEFGRAFVLQIVLAIVLGGHLCNFAHGGSARRKFVQ